MPDISLFQILVEGTVDMDRVVLPKVEITTARQ
jgi:hypothetical protein